MKSALFCEVGHDLADKMQHRCLSADNVSTGQSARHKSCLLKYSLRQEPTAAAALFMHAQDTSFTTTRG